MNILWLYGLPNWLFGVVVVTTFVGFALAGQILTRRFVQAVERRRTGCSDERTPCALTLP